MRYFVEVELGQKPTECAFSALVPDLPGCFSVGETIEELQANLKEAVEGWIEVAQDQGDFSHPMPTGFILQIEVAV
jgi:predicted RNase H-like HicB family nuclease